MGSHLVWKLGDIQIPFIMLLGQSRQYCSLQLTEGYKWDSLEHYCSLGMTFTVCISCICKYNCFTGACKVKSGMGIGMWQSSTTFTICQCQLSCTCWSQGQKSKQLWTGGQSNRRKWLVSPKILNVEELHYMQTQSQVCYTFDCLEETGAERRSTWYSPLTGWARAMCCQSDWHCSWFQGDARGTETGQSACWLSKACRYQLELNSTVSCDTLVKVSVTWQHMGLTGCSASSVWLGGQLLPQLLFRAGLEPAEDSAAVSQFHPSAHCVTTCWWTLGWELILLLCAFVFIFQCDGFIDSLVLFSFISWWLAKKFGYVTNLLAVREWALLY